VAIYFYPTQLTVSFKGSHSFQVPPQLDLTPASVSVTLISKSAHAYRSLLPYRLLLGVMAMGPHLVRVWVRIGIQPVASFDTISYLLQTTTIYIPYHFRAFIGDIPFLGMLMGRFVDSFHPIFSVKTQSLRRRSAVTQLLPSRFQRWLLLALRPRFFQWGLPYHLHSKHLAAFLDFKFLC